MSYAEFLSRKRRVWTGEGIEPSGLPPQLFDWQAAIVRWALRKGRAAIFADCGLGKSFMQIAWAQALGVPTLFLAPLCVAEQTVAEAAKLGVSLVYAKRPSDAGAAPLVITNYERLDDFDVSAFGAVVLDESSILKAFDGKTKQRLIEACAPVKYRLCCTATPSPNDIAELANHAEFLGLTTRAEFLATWFVHDDAGWRMKKHAVAPFYRWLASWAMALRAPSDIGYSDTGFVLPPLTVHDHVLEMEGGVDGVLFPEMGVKGLSGRLSARRASMEDRVAAAVSLATSNDEQWLIWCGLNEESDAVTESIPGAIDVAGADSYASKVYSVQEFLAGRIRVLVSKPKVLGFGMNFQHCHHMAFVGLSDSYEAYYQCVRRSWRFGQRHPVHAHVIFSEAEKVVVENVRRKERASRQLADELLEHMRDFEREEISA